jgi:hypothetical protein
MTLLGAGINLGSFVTSEFDWSSFTGDDFSGSDGSYPKADVWAERTSQTYDWNIQSNALYSLIGNSGNSDIVSTFKLTGDFDIQVKYFLESFTNSCDLIFGVQDQPTGANRGSNVRVATGAIEEYEEYYLTAATYPTFTKGNTNVRTQADGYLQIIRATTTFTIKYKDGLADSWNTLQAGRIVTGNDVYVRIQCSSNASGTGTIQVDDFTINSGTVIPPA